MLPVFLVGFSIFVLSDVTPIEVNTTSIFLGAMLLIGAIVFFVSEQVALFLVDIGLLFDEFLGRIAGLAVPAFAFLTFYAFLVIFFGAIYSILSQHSATPHFHVNGVDRPITFLEAIYFSVVTISTVGYGDVVPASNVMRVLASLQVICGVLLLLFGVSELLEYTREHRGGKDGSGGVK
jgi:voltage-gated potassium channel